MSMPLFSLLPSVIEALCERGYTMTYAHISEMGFPKYMAYLFVYMFFVEFGIYWMHRLLHDIPAGYKCDSSPLQRLVDTYVLDIGWHMLVQVLYTYLWYIQTSIRARQALAAHNYLFQLQNFGLVSPLRILLAFLLARDLASR